MRTSHKNSVPGFLTCGKSAGLEKSHKSTWMLNWYVTLSLDYHQGEALSRRLAQVAAQKQLETMFQDMRQKRTKRKGASRLLFHKLALSSGAPVWDMSCTLTLDPNSLPKAGQHPDRNDTAHHQPGTSSAPSLGLSRGMRLLSARQRAIYARAGAGNSHSSLW